MIKQDVNKLSALVKTQERGKVEYARIIFDTFGPLKLILLTGNM